MKGAAYRRGQEELAQWMVSHSFATGHGDTIADLLKELEWQIAERVKRGQEEMRERVATYMETHYAIMSDQEPSGYKWFEREKHPNFPLAKAIRAEAVRALPTEPVSGATSSAKRGDAK